MLNCPRSYEWDGRGQDEIFELTRCACPPHLLAWPADEADQPAVLLRLDSESYL